MLAGDAARGPNVQHLQQSARSRVTVSILTKMTDIVIADWGDDRKLQIRDGSPLADVLGSQRTPQRNEWFGAYFKNAVSALMACIVDSAYRLDTILTMPSPAGVSVVEYNILRPMLEYEYRLFRLIDFYLTVCDREQHAIEEWNAGYKQYLIVASEYQTAEQTRQFERWEPLLRTWYEELTGSENIRYLKPRHVFHWFDDEEYCWPRDRKDNPVNPVYQGAYSAFSAVEHGNLWALQKLAMNNPSALTNRGTGLDDATVFALQIVAGTILQFSYGFFKQFAGGMLDIRLMNTLETCLDAIRRRETDIECTGGRRG